MKNHIIQSGDLSVKQKALNHRMAIMKAIEKYQPQRLGEVISCMAEDENQETYFKTDFILDLMGFEIKEKYINIKK